MAQDSQEAPKLMVFTQDGVLAHVTNSQPWASSPHPTLCQLPQAKGLWTSLGLTKKQQPGSLRVEGWEHWEGWEVVFWDRRHEGAAPAPPQCSGDISKGHSLLEGGISSVLGHPEVVCAHDLAFRRSHSAGSR